MKPPNISHVTADISYRDSMDSLYQLKILVGGEYEDEISQQARNFKDVDLSSSHNVFYVRSIGELRSLMKPTPMYDFVIRSYLVYSFHENSSRGVYISSFGGNKITSSHVKSFLVHSISYTNDEGLLSHLIEMITGYHNSYDVQARTFMLSDCTRTHCRKQRIDDDLIIKSVLTGKNTNLSNKDVIAMMRDLNEVPDGMEIKDEFIAFQPYQIISLAYLLIEKKEVVAA